MSEKYSIKDVAALCGKKPFQVHYAISSGYLPEPTLRVANRRIFNEQDLAIAKKYFASEGMKEKKK